jgi:hypothetical protein
MENVKISQRAEKNHFNREKPRKDGVSHCHTALWGKSLLATISPGYTSFYKRFPACKPDVFVL